VTTLGLGMGEPPNGNGAYPWWVRAFVYVVQTVGVTAVISLGLLWWVLNSFDARLSAMSVEQTAMFRLLQQICVNTSETPEQRTACWNPWR
jgi:hypothetical protein